MAVLKRIRATLPQARHSGSRGTTQKPKAAKLPTFAGNAGTGGRK